MSHLLALKAQLTINIPQMFEAAVPKSFAHWNLLSSLLAK
jgi:hypothetical protein